MAGRVDYGNLFRRPPTEGWSHLSSVLDAIMDRDARAAQHKAQLEQAARLAAEDDARQRAQLDQTISHQQAQEERLRAKDAQDADDKTANRALRALEPFQGALKEGDVESAEQWAGPGGIGFKRRPETPAMDMLGAIRPQEAPMDPLGPQPPGAGEGEDDPFPEAPPMTPLDAQFKAQPPKPPKYDVTLPGGQTSEYDPAAARARRMERGGQTAQDIGGVQSPSPFHAQALAEVQSRLRAGTLKPAEADAEYAKRVDRMEAQAAAMERAKVVGGTGRERLDRAHPKNEREVTDFYGKPRGETFRVEEAEATRKKLGFGQTIVNKLEQMKDIVGGTGWVDRLPVVGEFTTAQRTIAADVDTILAQLTQFLGSGTPQDPEARRKIESLAVSWKQGKDISLRNLEELQAYIIASYENQVNAVTPGGRSAPARTAAPAAAVPADAITDELLGEP